MTALTLAAWDAIWDRFHGQALALRMSPNAAVAWADGRMAFHRHGARPGPVDTSKETDHGG